MFNSDYDSEDRRRWHECCCNGGAEGFALHRIGRDAFLQARLPVEVYESSGYRIANHCLIYGDYVRASEIAEAYAKHMRERYRSSSGDRRLQDSYRLLRGERYLELAKSAAELDEYSGASKPPRSLISRTEAERVLEENRSAMVLLSFETDERRRLCDLPEFALHECKLAGDRVRTHWKNWISKGLTYDERENIGELRRVCKHFESKYNRLKKFNRERVKHIREDEGNIRKPMIMDTLAKTRVMLAKERYAMRAYMHVKMADCEVEVNRHFYRFEHQAWRETWIAASIKDGRFKEAEFFLDMAIATAEKYILTHSWNNLGRLKTQLDLALAPERLRP